MVDVAVSTQLQQWTFEKTTLVRPERSDSSASSSPDLYHNDSETLRIDTAAAEDTQDLESKDTISFHDRYLSSEEDLSPMEPDSDFEYDDDVSIHEVVQQTFSARKMSISRVEKGKSFDLAVMVSYVSAGRPKMINLANVSPPVRETQRSASLAQLPIAAIKKLRDADQATRRSLVGPVSSSTTRSSSLASNTRQLSTDNLPLPHNASSIKLSDSSSSFVESTSSRSSSPSVPEISSRPATSAAPPTLTTSRSSLYMVTSANSNARRTPFPPLTPLSPEQHSFLSSDPYENNTTSAASPIIKSGPHKRLRSISQKLALAKIAITPSAKKWDSRINGRAGTMPPTPATPYTPVTPMTAPPTTTFSSPKNYKLRRNSKASRPSSMRGPSPDIPPVPALSANSSPKKLMQKMVPRGADERAPILELPPCPTEKTEDADPMGSIKSKRIRKRKSLMDLL